MRGKGSSFLFFLYTGSFTEGAGTYPDPVDPDISLLTKYPFYRALVIMHNLPSTGAFLREEGGPLRGG